MGFFGRTIGGALAGGVVGSMMGNSNMSTFGGMAAGAAFGGMGIKRLNPLASRLGNKMNISGMTQRGLNYGSKAFGRAGTRIASSVSNRAAAGTLTGFGAKMGTMGMNYSATSALGLNKATRFIRKNSSAVNKYGGYAMGAIGTAAAAHIGSSVLSSNRGY